MVARAAEPSRSASSSCAEPKMRRKSLVRKFPSLWAAMAVMVFTGVLRMTRKSFRSTLGEIGPRRIRLPVLECRLGAPSAHPGEGPVRGEFGALGNISAPDRSLDRVDRSPHDVERPRRIELADHGR